MDAIILLVDKLVNPDLGNNGHFISKQVNMRIDNIGMTVLTCYFI